MRSRITMKFKVALYPSEEGYSVSVPSLPGCWSQGATIEEALDNITDAIRDICWPNSCRNAAEFREVEVQF